MLGRDQAVNNCGLLAMSQELLRFHDTKSTDGAGILNSFYKWQISIYLYIYIDIDID